MGRSSKPAKEFKVTVTYSDNSKSVAPRRRVQIPYVNISAVRAKSGLSQKAFAESIGVSEGTLINWEQGRRQPTGPARVLLALIAKRPNLVVELYAKLYPPPPAWIGEGPDPATMTAEERITELGQILARGIMRMKAAEKSE
jgi:putative transcriptional regulator